MTQRESDAIVLYLHGARIDWADKTTPLGLLVWFDALKPFRAEMAQAAVKMFHTQRAAAKQGYPPDVGEVVEYLYRCGQAEDLKQRPHRDTGAKLLSGPIEVWGPAESLPALSVALVRDLMDGTVTPRSEEHKKRQAAVEALARVGPPPCCDRDGLTSYEVERYGNRYVNAARCDCPRGQASPYRSYPVVDRSRAVVDTSWDMLDRAQTEQATRTAEGLAQCKRVFG